MTDHPVAGAPVDPAVVEAVLAELVDAEPTLAGPRPAAGPWDPVAEIPALVAGGVRRATSIEMFRPDGYDHPLRLVVRARDIRADADGSTEVLDDLEAVVDAEEWSGAVLAVDGLDHPGASGLVGRSLRYGYGRTAAELLADDLAERTLVAAALEDLGGALLVSGYAPLRRDRLPIGPGHGAERAEMQQDICAGWATGYELVELLRREDRSAVPIGPVAPELAAVDGWGDGADRVPDTVTRVRTLDAVRSRDGSGFDVRAHFRDSYEADSGPMVMHEYLVHAHVDPRDGDARGPVIDRIDVEPRVLPWSRCPSAVPSAGRVVGTRVADLPGFVRAEMTGTSTCTHLNSTVRSLADVAALVHLL